MFQFHFPSFFLSSFLFLSCGRLLRWLVDKALNCRREDGGGKEMEDAEEVSECERGKENEQEAVEEERGTTKTMKRTNGRRHWNHWVLK